MCAHIYCLQITDRYFCFKCMSLHNLCTLNCDEIISRNYCATAILDENFIIL